MTGNEAQKFFSKHSYLQLTFGEKKPFLKTFLPLKYSKNWWYAFFTSEHFFPSKIFSLSFFAWFSDFWSLLQFTFRSFSWHMRDTLFSSLKFQIKWRIFKTWESFLLFKSHLKSLDALSLSGNEFMGFEGILPQNVQTLDISNNNFEKIPEIFHLTENLFYLSVANNKLSGEISKYFQNFTNLSYVALHNNRFRGSLPFVPQASIYSMFGNQFTGRLNQKILPRQDKKDSIFLIHNNRLSCDLPKANHELVHFKASLCLMGNRFDGSDLPQWIDENEKQASFLTVSNNQIYFIFTIIFSIFGMLIGIVYVFIHHKKQSTLEMKSFERIVHMGNNFFLPFSKLVKWSHSFFQNFCFSQMSIFWLILLCLLGGILTIFHSLNSNFVECGGNLTKSTAAFFTTNENKQWFLIAFERKEFSIQKTFVLKWNDRIILFNFHLFHSFCNIFVHFTNQSRIQKTEIDSWNLEHKIWDFMVEIICVFHCFDHSFNSRRSEQKFSQNFLTVFLSLFSFLFSLFCLWFKACCARVHK